MHKIISFHCEGAENHDYQLKLCALTAHHNMMIILIISTYPFILPIYHILDFWSKIRFRIHIIIIQGQMHPLKISQKLTVRGGVGVHPYGQPDRKILVFFLRLPFRYHLLSSE